MRRVSVAGISGSGKTTFARALAGRLGVPWIELDALNHGPNWTPATRGQLRARVQAAVAAAPDGWVIDGNYRAEEALGDFVLSQADTLVWLRLPLHVSLGRLAMRTWRRWWNREELWNGNRETIGNWFAWDGLFVWTIRAYFRQRRELPAAIARNPRLQVVQLRSAGEVERFLLTERRPAPRSGK